MKTEWLIIGGGIHGVHIAARLLEAGVCPEGLRIIDPASRLLARWRTCTETTGMRHLRSPAVHHLDLSPWSLQQFAGKRARRKRGLFAPPYDRPSLDLFNAHCDTVIETFGLDARHLQARATQCAVDCQGVTVQLCDGRSVTTQNLVLAIGAGEQPAWPDWAPRNHPRVQHIFARNFTGWPQETSSVAVIGGGISAAQVALRLQTDGHQVHMVSRHALRQHQFDSDPGWLGPKFMVRFENEPDLRRRRRLISEARHKGSVPPDVRHALRRAIQRDRLRWHEGEVLALGEEGSDLTLQLHTEETIRVAHVLLATGFHKARPGGSMVDNLITSASLPCAACGYPVVDDRLRWHPRIYVSGPLAELALGPASRNIAGARRAADRMVAAVRRSGQAAPTR